MFEKYPIKITATPLKLIVMYSHVTIAHHGVYHNTADM